MSGPGEPGRIAHLWRYPVSSLAGESLNAARVDRDGVEGDRLYGLFDAETDAIAGPEMDARWHGVPRIAARVGPAGGLEVRVPDGKWLPAPGEAADRAASLHLGFAASIRPFAGVFTARYVKEPIHLVTTASLVELKRLHPAGDPDPRRFRPNVLVDMAPVAGRFPETEWIGQRLALGEVELTVVEACRRCGFTIIAQDGFHSDPDILRTLVRNNAHNLGVYCEVARPGTVRVGDAMRFLD